jgi:hypothetical protein
LSGRKPHLHVGVPLVCLIVRFFHLLQETLAWLCTVVVRRTFLLDILDDMVDSMLFEEFEAFIVFLCYELPVVNEYHIQQLALDHTEQQFL